MANQVVRDTSANMQVDNTHQIPSALQPPPHTAAGPRRSTATYVLYSGYYLVFKTLIL